MDTEKVVRDLNQRFAAPLPEFYKRRIIFWLDEDREFEDKLDDMELANAKLIRLTGSNTFAVKKLLAVDDTTSNFVVYRPFGFEKDDDNWLLNVELYSEEFRSDLISSWMEEMRIASTPALRKAVKAYRKFFNAKERRDKVLAITHRKDIDSERSLHLAVMGAIVGCVPQPKTILRSVLSAGLHNDGNAIYRKLVSFGADSIFWRIAKDCFGYQEQDLTNNGLGRLATQILLTAASRTLGTECFAGLDGFISIPHQANCFDFVSEWLHSDSSSQLYEIARFVEDEARLPQRFSQAELSFIADTECFPCIDEVILRTLMKEISDRLIDAPAITNLVEKRRTCVWFDLLRYYYEGILQIANMQAFYKEHSGEFHMVEPQKIWKAYTATYYKMDTYYRLFHLAFSRSLRSSNPELDDLFKHDADIVEGLYTNWFLEELGNSWSNVCADNLKDYGYILDVDRQTDFYHDYIKNANSRIFVIVSDALRFEVAASLCEQLQAETQAQVSLKSVQGIFPTITKFGMAAVLPHKELTVDFRGENLRVLADGNLTESDYRDKILKAENPKSVALKYSSVVKAKRQERNGWVKGMEVVYIYHDTIDEASHNADASVFPSCDDAISEIKNLIRIIVNDFGATNIIVTADHGFLYTYSPLTESSKLDKSSFKNLDVDYGRRYAIMQRGAEPDYLLPVNLLGGKTEFDGFAPRENIRIKMSGGGLNFVHGGISLQEMVVPVIEYHFLRNSAKEYRHNRSKYDTKPVTVNLLSANRKISNMIFSLNFYQQEAVSGNREAANYFLYFVDAAGKQISDTQKIIADKAGDGNERTFRCGFNLKSLPYSRTETYYLMIVEESGTVLPKREEFQIDIAFAVDEFNFF